MTGTPRTNAAIASAGGSSYVLRGKLTQLAMSLERELFAAQSEAAVYRIRAEASEARYAAMDTALRECEAALYGAREVVGNGGNIQHALTIAAEALGERPKQTVCSFGPGNCQKARGMVCPVCAGELPL